MTNIPTTSPTYQNPDKVYDEATAAQQPFIVGPSQVYEIELKFKRSNSVHYTLHHSLFEVWQPKYRS